MPELGNDQAGAAEDFSEHELLERFNTVAACNPPQRAPHTQRRLSALAGFTPDSASVRTVPSPEQLPPEGADACADFADGPGTGMDLAYMQHAGASLMLQQISQEMEEVLEAIDAQQKQNAAAAVAAIREVQQAALQTVPQGSAAGAEPVGCGAYHASYDDVDAEHDDDEEEEEDNYDGDAYDDYDAAQAETQSDAHASHTLATEVWEGDETGERKEKKSYTCSCSRCCSCCFCCCHV